MKNVMICTVGTSLKANLLREADSGFKALLETSSRQALVLKLSHIDPEDRLNGAEINSITRILKKKMIGRRDHLYLLVSDTTDGLLTGEILSAYYLRRQNPFYFEYVQPLTIEGLTDQSVHRFRTEGLRNLVKAIARIVKKHGSQSILINATGGYKAQISFAGMIGQALEIPVCYLFESFSEVITLPPQPVSLDLSFWLKNADLFFELANSDGKDNPAIKDERFSALVEEEDIDGETVVGLSATGQLFHEMLQHRFYLAKKDLLPPDSGIDSEKKTIKFEDLNKGKHPGLKTYLEKLSRIPYIVRINSRYYNRDLPLKNSFRASAQGDFSVIEGSFSDGKATTKFDVVTTAGNEGERNAALADLAGWL
jgi:putative CRISPR-associated protein (TIGR02619 family)